MNYPEESPAIFGTSLVLNFRKLEKRPWRTETMIPCMTSMLPGIPLEKRGFLRWMGFMEGTPAIGT
jgi:hypothetical protein